MEFKIISRLWSSIYDLKMLIRGTGGKRLEEIERDLDATEMLCRQLAGVDDDGG